MNEIELRHEICRIGKSLFDRGYVHATAGNISVEIPKEEGGGFLITPTDACLGFLEPKKLARLNRDGEQISGDKASKTIFLHRKIYEASSTTNTAASCVIHTHSTHCVALTVGWDHEPELLPALTPYFVMKVGHVPVISYRRPGDPETAIQVANVIRNYSKNGQPIRAVMLSRLGPNVWHDTPAQAMATLEELEETARLWWMSERRSNVLTDENIREICHTFRATW